MLFNKLGHYFILFLNNKYLQMFKMSDLSIALQSTETSYTLLFKVGLSPSKKNFSYLLQW